MSRAASGKALKLDVPAYEPPSDMHVNLKKHPHMDGNHKVGDKIKFMAHGKISSMNKDKHSSTMRIEVHGIKKMASNLKKSGPFDQGQDEVDDGDEA